MPRGRDREVTARRVRGVTMRAALDRIADESRSVDTRSRSGKTPARVRRPIGSTRAIPSAPSVGSASIARGHVRRAEHLVRVSSTPVARVRVRSPVCARREACAVGCARARGAAFENRRRRQAVKRGLLNFFFSSFRKTRRSAAETADAFSRCGRVAARAGVANRERDRTVWRWGSKGYALARRGRFLSIMMSHRIAHHITRYDALRRKQERDDVRQTHHPLHHAGRRVHRHQPPHARERERLHDGAQ